MRASCRVLLKVVLAVDGFGKSMSRARGSLASGRPDM